MSKSRHLANRSGIKEDIKMTIISEMNQFVANDDIKELTFDSSLTSNERKYIHNYCAQFGLTSKSKGNGDDRYITVFKKDTARAESLRDNARLALCQTAKQHIQSLIARNLRADMNRNKQPANQRKSVAKKDGKKKYLSGQLFRNGAQVPAVGVRGKFEHFRQQLPIWRLRDRITKSIADHRVVIISGETGCGKSTQVPQYILDYCAANNQKCRIICAQPRRLAAISVAERVSAERGEHCGQSVGYQIRLESCVSANTLLTFCTNGVVLRSLMFDRRSFTDGITHVIIDEVHERDKFSDFLLLILREMIASSNSNVRLVLMSATVDTKSFSNYFNNCPTIEIPRNNFEVKSYFLEDVLNATNYLKKHKKHILAESQSLNNGNHRRKNRKTKDKSPEIDPQLIEKMDDCLRTAWIDGSEQAFDEMMAVIIESDYALIDYQNSQAGITALIAAAARSKLETIETLLEFGANAEVRTPDNMTALDWAKYFDQKQAVSCLEIYAFNNNTGNTSENSGENQNDSQQTQQTNEEKDILDVYHDSFNDDEVDIELIGALLAHLLATTRFGAILVFLPGNDDIVKMRDLIQSDSNRFDANRYQLFILHSQMQNLDQRNVFKRLPNGQRKVILSTNIAETSITIDDVVYIVDCGKVKEKSYDALTGVSSLKSMWISQSSALQRRGRAGRTRDGVCYHLFSRKRFENMQRHQLPEILRIPIHELCLQTKLLVPDSRTSINEFLLKAMDPPSITSVKNSVRLLKTIDALDSLEQLTNLGLHLLDLPIEPNYGKMIIFSIILGCVDPVLTIVSTLTYRDPFIISTHSDDKFGSNTSRKHFSNGIPFSDHLIYLNVFNKWLDYCQSRNQEKSFCRQHFLSSATMHLIYGIRQQLYSHLKSFRFYRNEPQMNRNSDKWSVIKAALCAGGYPKLIRVDSSRRNLINDKETKIRFHPSSILNCSPETSKFCHNKAKLLAALPSDWLIYEEMNLIGRTPYAKCCTIVSPITVALFSGAIYSGDQTSIDNTDRDCEWSDSSLDCLKIDDWITFEMETSIAKLVVYLRNELRTVFANQIDDRCDSGANERNQNAINTIVNVLQCAEQAIELKRK